MLSFPHDWTAAIHYISDSISRIQMVQNTAARLLTGSRKRDHITPILHTLHWLPVRYRIYLKKITFTYKACCKQAPKYLSEPTQIT